MIFGQVCKIYPSTSDKKVNLGYWDLLGDMVAPMKEWKKNSSNLISYFHGNHGLQHDSVGDFQDPTDGGTFVPYCWPYVVGISSYIDLIYGRYLQSIGS